MGQTIIEKILSHNTGKNVKPGDIVTVNVDRVMLDDIMIPFIVDKFHEMGFAKVWDPDKVVRRMIPDISMWEMLLQLNTA